MKPPSMVLGRSHSGEWGVLYLGDDATPAFGVYEKAVDGGTPDLERVELHVRGEFRRRHKVKTAPEARPAATPKAKAAKPK